MRTRTRLRGCALSGGAAAAIALPLLLAGMLWSSGNVAAEPTGPTSRPDGSTPLQWAVFEGDDAEVKRLLAAGADPTVANDYGVDALQLAADSSNNEVIRLLLKAGANANSANPEGETVLHLVARAGNVEAAKLLLRAGARVDARERFGEQTPLMWATARRHPEMVRLLVSKGAEVDARSAVRDYQRVATAESRSKQLDRGGFTPLMYAARENCRECVKILLKDQADISLPDPAGMTALHIALLNANWDIARALIEAGAGVNQWDVFGQGPLNVAIANLKVRGSANPLDQNEPNQASAEDVVKLLVERGANPNQQLFYAAARILGADTGRGTTPFLTACASGDIEIVRLLLAHGANPKLATSDGQGAIILATASRTGGTGYPGSRYAGVPVLPPIERDPATVELLKLLVASGADINLIARPHYLQRTRGGSALHYAVRAANKDVMAALVELGIDVNAKDEDGLTALDYAMGRGFVPFLRMANPPRQDLVALLRGWGANVELTKIPEWPPQGPPHGTAIFDAVLWPVDPVGP